MTATAATTTAMPIAARTTTDADLGPGRPLAGGEAAAALK